MYLTKIVRECMLNLIGWKNHYDLAEIPALDVELNKSESGQYYQDFHPALRLDLISQAIPANRDIEEYLKDKVETGITHLLSTLVTRKRFEKYAKRILVNNTILDRPAFITNSLANTGRFVGFKFKPEQSIGLNSVIKKIGIQLNANQDPLKIYVFHTSHPKAIKTIDVTIDNSAGWNWVDIDLNLPAEGTFDNGTDTFDIVGGMYMIGYYQDDLIGEALMFNNFDWFNGPCSNCVGSVRADSYRNLQKYMRFTPFYVPAGSLPADPTDIFNFEDGYEEHTVNYGLNFNVSAECDLSDFFCMNRASLIRALGLQVTYLILKDIEFSQQMNFIEENLRNLIIRDLEGDRDTNYINIVDQLLKEIDAVEFDHSKLGGFCLPCDHNKGVTYGVA